MSDSSAPLSVNVDLGLRSYGIRIVSGELAETAKFVTEWCQRLPGSGANTRTALLVTDRNIAGSHAETVRAGFADAGWIIYTAELEAGEQSKALSVINTMYDTLVEHRADRYTLVIAVGGGVVGDAAGFVAATYARGLPFVQVPTTLLAQVDSSVGGKVGVNHPKGKNLIGAFHQPLGVLIDTDTLNTLPDRDYRSGLAEVVKYGVILDAEFFARLESDRDALNARDAGVLREVVARCCRLKADVVEQDEQERTGLRAVLNYGHTFAHAYEALSGYGELMHGEAVSIGMVHASRLAERLGLIDAAATSRQVDLLRSLHLPTELSSGGQFTTDDVLQRMKLDKKTVAGQLRFVLPQRIGHVEVFTDVAEQDVRAVLDESLA